MTEAPVRPQRPSRAALPALLLVCLVALAAQAGSPAERSVIEVEEGLGEPGGELRSRVGGTRDTRLLVVYG